MADKRKLLERAVALPVEERSKLALALLVLVSVGECDYTELPDDWATVVRERIARTRADDSKATNERFE